MNVEDKFEEQVAIGGPMIDQKVLKSVLAEVTPADFYHPAHEVILDAMNALDREGKPVDVVTVGDHLERTGDLSRVGGRVYLHECSQAVPVSLNAPYYAQIVRDKAHRRSLQGVAARLQQSASGGVDVSHAIEIARREIDTTSLSRQGHVRSNISDAVAEALASLKRPVSMRTPWKDLNASIAGWMPGMFYAVGARPSVGKTSLLSCATLHATKRNAGTVLIFSLEMGRDEFTMRMMINMSGVDGQRVLHRSTRGDDDERLERAGDLVNQMDLVVMDGNWTLEEIRTKVLEYQSRAPVALVGIDFLQEIAPPSGPALDEHLRIGRDAQNLKRLALEADVPVVALAALNREIDQRSVKMPSLSDFKGSSGVESAADVAILMHRVNLAQEQAGLGDSTELQMIVAKNRQGPQDAVRLKYDGPHFRITDWPSLYDQRPEQ